MTNRPKFFLSHGPCELRVEQIGPHLWHTGVYEMTLLKVDVTDEAGKVTDSNYHQLDSWERFTCMSESCAKRCALQTVVRCAEERRMDLPAPPAPWGNRTELSNDDWAAELRRQQFPGYIAREGLERFQEFL